LFCYLYLLIVGLDDPFDISNDEIDVDIQIMELEYETTFLLNFSGS